MFEKKAKHNDLFQNFWKKWDVCHTFQEKGRTTQ
jgi:hypothetical protein